MADAVFDCRWSEDITPVFMSDFISVLETVWKKDFDHDTFQCRYINNIYGASLLIIVYIDGKPSGTQAFWRNDIDKQIAYQADDGAVLESCRGNGLLGKMIKKGTEILGNDVLLYSFTNINSKKAFVKLGWDVMLSHHIKPFICAKYYCKQCPQMADYEYTSWYLHRKKHISYVKRNNHFFLVIPTTHRYVYQIISSCNQETAMFFNKVKGFALLIYNKQPNDIDHEKKGGIVVAGYRGEHIPIWKCDAI